MGPKKQAESKKNEQKKKDKIIEDKTFGLKNKKGAKQQKFIQKVTTQVQYGNQKAKQERTQAKETDSKTKKEDKLRQIQELNALFKPVVEKQKLDKGVDPKSVLCVFFKQGQCQKGNKCKFSHDFAVERRTEKRNIYADMRDEENMDEWDEATLEDVVNKKHGEANKSKPKTAIICKYFLDAVENSKYGWFWECPNGVTCHYRHALPAGFVLKKDRKRMDEQTEPTVSLEELIETERAKLGSNTTKITLQSFLEWKKRKRSEKVAAAEKEKSKKRDDFALGKVHGISGREMFEFDPSLVGEADDDDDEGGQVVVRERTEDSDDDGTEQAGREINLEDMAAAATDVDATAMTASEKRPSPTPPSTATSMEASNGPMAATGGPDIEIDEELFIGGDDIDAELEELDLVD